MLPPKASGQPLAIIAYGRPATVTIQTNRRLRRKIVLIGVALVIRCRQTVGVFLLPVAGGYGCQALIRSVNVLVIGDSALQRGQSMHKGTLTTFSMGAPDPLPIIVLPSCG